MSSPNKKAQNKAGHAAPESKDAAEETVTTLTDEQFVALRLGTQNAGKEEKPTEPETETETETETEAGMVEESTAPERFEEEATETDLQDEVESEDQKETDVLAKLEGELEALSEAELKELGRKLGSRTISRIGELTERRKSVEEENAGLRAKLQAMQESSVDPLKGNPEVKDNPYADIKTLEDLQAKAREVEALIEWADEVLFNSSDDSPEDFVAKLDGKEVTKSEVRKYLQNARKSRKVYLPAQLKQLQMAELAQQLQRELEAAAPKELPWITKEEDPTHARYKAMIGDPRLVALKQQASPDVAAQLDYLIAHAVNSLSGMAASTKGKPPTKAKSKPPHGAIPNGSAAPVPNSRRTANTEQLNRAAARFQESGSETDFVHYRTQQLQPS